MVVARGTQWIEVDAAALRHNLGLFRELLKPGTRLAVVVKANAYGHGFEQVAPIAAQVADLLAVHSAAEARSARGAGIAVPILVMGCVPPHDLYDLDRDTHIFVSTEETLASLGDYRRRTGVALPVHLKVDTGARRQGLDIRDIASYARAAAREGLDIVGLATHFANIEDTLEHDFARLQLERFHGALEATRSALGSTPGLVHASCSAAALLFRETDFSMVRVGISAYGHWPSRETKLSWILNHGPDGLRLQPALCWKAIVGQLKDVAKGETVGYGRTWEALRQTRIAVVPVGYADGYSRVLGNRSRVIVRGVVAPVVGRVCMNILMVDVSDIPEVCVGDEVVLIGQQGGSKVTIEELAALSGTINYEFVARLSHSIPRIVVEGGGGVEGGSQE